VTANPEEWVLAIDTAGPVVGAGLWHPERCRVWSARAGRDADALLGPVVAELLEDRPKLVAVAVAVGPGAFTGLRVGVATALGVAVAYALPVVPVCSLTARAGMVTAPRVLALLDARKQRFYAQWFDTRERSPVPLSEPVDAPLSAVLADGEFIAVGEGACVAREVLIEAGGREAEQAEQCPVEIVGELGWFGRDQGLDPGEIALRYLRAADAKPQVKGGKSLDTSIR